MVKHTHLANASRRLDYGMEHSSFDTRKVTGLVAGGRRKKRGREEAIESCDVVLVAGSRGFGEEGGDCGG